MCTESKSQEPEKPEKTGVTDEEFKTAYRIFLPCRLGDGPPPPFLPSKRTLYNLRTDDER